EVLLNWRDLLVRAAVWKRQRVALLSAKLFVGAPFRPGRHGEGPISQIYTDKCQQQQKQWHLTGTADPQRQAPSPDPEHRASLHNAQRSDDALSPGITRERDYPAPSVSTRLLAAAV